MTILEFSDRISEIEFRITDLNQAIDFLSQLDYKEANAEQLPAIMNILHTNSQKIETKIVNLSNKMAKTKYIIE